MRRSGNTLRIRFFSESIMSNRTLAFIALTVVAIIWGVTLPLMKANLTNLPPLTIAFIRFSQAAVLTLIFAELRGLTIKDFFQIAFFSFFGITLNIGLLLLGLAQTTAINASIILALSPIVTSALTFFTLKEKINRVHLLGIILALFGSLIYLISPWLFSNGNLKFNLSGDLLVIAAVVASAIYLIGSKKLFDKYHPSSISAVSFVVGAISFFPGAVFEYFKNPLWVNKVSSFNIISLIFLGVFSSFIAYSLLIWGLSKVDVHVNSTIGYLTAIISVVISTIFLGEKLYPITFSISFALVGLGIYLVTKYKPTSHHFHQHTHHI